MFIFYNPNPQNRNVGDCAVRAISKALNIPWEKAYAMISSEGFSQCDMPSSNHVWGACLNRHGFVKCMIEYMDEYNLIDFCNDHKQGVYVVALSGHVVTVKDGDYYDTWDSGTKIPLYYWRLYEDM